MITPKRSAYALPKPVKVVASERLPSQEPPLTIVAGFRCYDGHIICADSEENKGDYAKVSRPKIFIHPSENSELLGQIPVCRAVFAGSGLAVPCDHVIQKLSKKLDSITETDDVDAVVAKIDEELLAINDRWPLYGSDGKASIDLLGSVWRGGNLRMIRIEGHRLLDIGGDYECVGYGVVLATYLAEQLLSHGMNMSAVTPIALYILEAVKAHVPFCGKDSHIVAIKVSDGSIFRPDKLDIEGQAKVFSQIDKALGPLFTRIANPYSSSDDIEKVLKEFTGYVRSVQEQYQKWRQQGIEAREKHLKALQKAFAKLSVSQKSEPGQ
jgi:hypothetical protein